VFRQPVSRDASLDQGHTGTPPLGEQHPRSPLPHRHMTKTRSKLSFAGREVGSTGVLGMTLTFWLLQVASHTMSCSHIRTQLPNPLSIWLLCDLRSEESSSCRVSCHLPRGQPATGRPGL
jgi:hypothetical protein